MPRPGSFVPGSCTTPSSPADFDVVKQPEGCWWPPTAALSGRPACLPRGLVRGGGERSARRGRRGEERMTTATSSSS
eukprot:9470686-Pyramimonas_sp.AAC.1